MFTACGGVNLVNIITTSDATFVTNARRDLGNNTLPIVTNSRIAWTSWIWWRKNLSWWMHKVISMSLKHTQQGISLHIYYRAMHFGAKCGIAIACHLSICLSVTLVDLDHIGWKSWKLTAWSISPTPSLFVAQKPSTYSQGNTGKFRGDRGGVRKSGVLEHKSGNISETRKDKGKVTTESL